MSWTIKGEFIEACSCNMLCPCWYGVQELMIMDQGWCASPWLIRIEKGESNGVDISGCNLALVSFFPGPTLFDGEGTGRVYLDKNNSDDQRRELEAIFTATRGGPLDVIGSLVSTWLSTIVTDISVSEKNGTISADIGDFGSIVSTRMVNEEGKTVALHDAGFALIWNFENNIAEMAPSDGTNWHDPDFPVAWEGKSGAVGHFSWSVQ
jgi:hypothetical protein